MARAKSRSPRTPQPAPWSEDRRSATFRCSRRTARPPKLNVKQESHLVALHKAGEHTSAELAELFGVARSTVYRAIDRAKVS
ncbi:helix-turn-helix domain-containing protein [Actinoplanes sp. URMC 104]|uniref:helix-turn-helix domain-containing protein n=1 Tax=Actinoplanes sp. URMC 104 TaxID=3423409 RepID=UPI003F1AC273